MAFKWPMCETKIFAEIFPRFYSAVRDFPDFQVEPPISAAEIVVLEERLNYSLHQDLRDFFQITGALSMNGLKIKASDLGVIRLPQSEGLILGYFYLNHPADRLLMLPNDSSIYYLEQSNGAINRLAGSLGEFFNHTLLRYL